MIKPTPEMLAAVGAANESEFEAKFLAKMKEPAAPAAAAPVIPAPAAPVIAPIPPAPAAGITEAQIEAIVNRAVEASGRVVAGIIAKSGALTPPNAGSVADDAHLQSAKGIEARVNDFIAKGDFKAAFALSPNLQAEFGEESVMVAFYNGTRPNAKTGTAKYQVRIQGENIAENVTV